MSHRSRRQFLRLGVPLVAVLAGCAETQPATTDGDGTASPAAGASATAEPEQTATSATTSTTTASDELDLREANVVGVAVESQSDGFRFDVTLIHNVHESKALVSKPERGAFWLRQWRGRLRELVAGRDARRRATRSARPAARPRDAGVHTL